MMFARNADRSHAASVLAAFVLTCLFLASSRAGDEPKKVALLVGVNQYKTRILVDKPLEFAERDVTELAFVLKEQGFQVETLAGSEATKAKIDEALKRLLHGREASDLVLLGFAGHGVQMPLVDEKGAPVVDTQGKPLSDAYFCPVNAVFGDGTSMISLTKLFERLDREGGINLLLVDACRDNPDTSRGLGGSTRVRSLSGDELVGRLPRNSAILFSCAVGQKALETEKAGGGHGVFFFHVIEALRGQAADPETHEVDWEDLTRYVRRRVNIRAKEWDPESAKFADQNLGGLLQTPHLLGNLVATPVLARMNVPGRRAPGFAESIGIKIVPIPTGEFWMGSSPAQIDLVVRQYPDLKKEQFDDEQPRHRVRVTKLQGLSAHEITLGQFLRFVADSGYRTDAERDGKGGYGFNSATRKFEQDAKYTWRNAGFAQSDDHPVVNVSWNDATEFCRWLTRKDGRSYRLPTEAEWEYACRAGTDTLYANGDDPERLALVGNVADAQAKARFPDWKYTIAANDGFVFTAPVGHFAPNAWGLYDMHGNVWEWCLDNYDVVYYKNSPTVDPRGPATAPSRVFRGGSWFYGGAGCRSAYRFRYAPGGRSSLLGFRVARVPSGP